MHCLLAVNALLEHAVKTTVWIPDFQNKVINSKLGPSECSLYNQQKIIFHLVAETVPKNSKGGFFDDPYTGNQSK